MSRDEKIAEARRMREAGATFAVIAAELGSTTATVQRWAKPDFADRQRAKAREWKDAHREANRARDRDYLAAKPGTCRRCTGPTSYDRDGGVCMTCRATVRHERAIVIVKLWGEGKTSRQIAEAVGWSTGALSVEMDRLRHDGYDLPYRSGKRGGTKYPELAGCQ